jgi:hypothetical protein
MDEFEQKVNRGYRANNKQMRAKDIFLKDISKGNANNFLLNLYLLGVTLTFALLKKKFIYGKP